MKHIFSGVQPTGNLHLGNYLGAIKNFVNLQNSEPNYKCLYCVVDMHAITVWQEPKLLKRSIREVIAIFLASGLDPKKSIIFNQSKVSSHAELAWIFNCVSRLGWLNRMTQFKEKAGKKRENASVGLYTYPNLMAADILSYLAEKVPVGNDQKQHLELVNNISQKFNFDFKINFFPEIKPIILGNVARVMSLRDGKNKMSKSDPSEFSRINILDDADAIVLKIKKAKTDSDPLPGIEWLDNDGKIDNDKINLRPEAANLLIIYASITGETNNSVIEKFGGKKFSEFKSILSDALVNLIVPIGAEAKRIIEDPEYIDSILNSGAVQAKKISDPVISKVKDIVGFI